MQILLGLVCMADLIEKINKKNRKTKQIDAKLKLWEENVRFMLKQCVVTRNVEEGEKQYASFRKSMKKAETNKTNP